ncbi:efflux RND transporter periplasmic adaptor subunit [Candidatus Gracilibacteria bacterium]|nr:efflux RND transporter periplasmic adaptor subunit [Candidatus Gracilibacteria bacterium]NJM86219.1 efflux RND transporter periplasmic adaptor subunit [Hydrococcus sp. RU_2_2]NJP17726.1 efflux RND transporter periplasmic adaptor subunit [Hydrococcus sp. CRU_1_1]
MEFSLFNKKLYPWILTLIATGVLGIISFEFLKNYDTTSNQDIANQTVLVKNENLVMQIQANGVVQAVRKVNLSSEDAGRIVKLYVQEGDRVIAGQIIARMNSTRLQAQVNQNQALVEKAEADLQQKRTGARVEVIDQARAKMAQAQADLERVKNTQKQEIDQVREEIRSAQAKVRLAETRLIRYEKLEREGAIALDALNQWQTEYKTAFSDREAAQKKLEQVQNSKQQEIARQEAALQEAKEVLRELENGTRREEIAQAEAEVSQAKAQLAYYQTQLNDKVIKAPFPGIITRRFAQEGDFVTPETSASATEGATSTSIAELSSGLEIEAKIPEASIAKIFQEQTVNVQVDAYPDETFKGKVSLIAPRAVQENNITSFRVKVALQTGQDKLRSGMNVRLAFLSKPIKNALTVPLAAVVTQPDGQTGVYVVNGESEARFQPIKVSTANSDRIQVLAGLKNGDRIFITPPENLKIEGVDSVNVNW